MAVHRNRVIYQSEALFISPDSTGYHYTGAKLTNAIAGIGDGPFGLMTPPKSATQSFGGDATNPATDGAGRLFGWDPENDSFADWPKWNPVDQDGNSVISTESSYAKNHGTIIKQLKRIQTANYGFTINREDINQFGHASRLDSVIVESPTVNLDFSYYILDGYNERMLEFVTDGQTNSFSGLLTPELYQAGNSFFILTAPESRDAVGGDANDYKNGNDDYKSVIALGNGYVTDYSVDIAVGAVPTASVTIEGMNIQSDVGTTGRNLPAIDMKDGSRVSDAWEYDDKGVISKKEKGCTGLYSLPAAVSGFKDCSADGDGNKIISNESTAALRPGDVVLNLRNASLLHKSVTGGRNETLMGSAHVQSVNINVPMGRTTLQRLGSTFGFCKAIDLPLSMTMSVTALVSDLKENSLIDELCNCERVDLELDIYNPDCNGCLVKTGNMAMKYALRGAVLESENYSSSVGDNKTVDLTFTAQVGGADDLTNGLFISGIESKDAAIKGFPPAWTGVGGTTMEAADHNGGVFMGYRH